MSQKHCSHILYLVANSQFLSQYSLPVEYSKALGTTIMFLNIYVALDIHQVTAHWSLSL